MQSNRDYATENLNLIQKIKEYQEHFIMLNGKMKDLEKENEKLKKAIKILNRYIDIKENHTYLNNKYYHTIRLDYHENLTKEEYDLLKEVFKK